MNENLLDKYYPPMKEETIKTLPHYIPYWCVTIIILVSIYCFTSLSQKDTTEIDFTCERGKLFINNTNDINKVSKIVALCNSLILPPPLPTPTIDEEKIALKTLIEDREKSIQELRSGLRESNERYYSCRNNH